MSDYSLITLLRDDPDFGPRLAKKKEEVKKDKQNLLRTAADYSEKYHEQIAEGTRRSTKMLTDGRKLGKPDEETMKEVYSGGFIPMVSTPILNLLYFILHESEEIDRELYRTRDIQNQQYGNIEDRESETLSDNFRTPDDLFTYLYGNITLDTFGKLKKLKALTKSKNIDESTLAFKKCRELCQKYNIEYDKIPCYVT